MMAKLPRMSNAFKSEQSPGLMPPGGDTVDFRRAWPPAKDLIRHDAYQDNMKNTGVAGLCKNSETVVAVSSI